MSCKSIFLFGRDRSSRPGRAVLREHGAQGRVKAGRRAARRRGLDVSRPRLDRPSTVLPLREAGPILGMGLQRQQAARFRHPQLGRLEMG